MEDFKLCPNCGCELNINTHSGYCPKCGYAYKISQFEAESIQRRILADYSNDDYSSFITEAGPKDRPKDWFVKREYITASIKENNLINYLKTIFDKNDVEHIAALYRVETHTKDDYSGAAIFYQYDNDLSQIAFKVMQYDKTNGHRGPGKSKQQEDLDAETKIENESINESDGKERLKKNEKDLVYQKSLIGPGEYCFFGRHLLNRDDAHDKPICIVESEKSAIIAALAYPEAIWMAAGSCYFLTHKKLDKDFNDREIIFFPDVDVKYEPLDIDEESGIPRCINWYVIKDRPHEIGISTEINKVTVSGFLDSYIKDLCINCEHKKYCSNSIYYDLSCQPFTIEDRERKFELTNKGEELLNTDKEKRTIPKIVLETEENKKRMSCIYRGWDIGDYIIHAIQNNEKLVPFSKLISDLKPEITHDIKEIISTIEASINLSKWLDCLPKR